MKVLVLPKDTNPYQEKLYSHMPKDVQVEYIKNLSQERILALLGYMWQLVTYRLKGFSVLHIHWLYCFALPSPRPLQAFILKSVVTVYLFSFLLFARLLGYKVLWTIHNLVPHEALTHNDMFITRLFCALCNAVVLLSSDTIQELKDNHIPLPRYNIIPLGNYTDTYPNTISRDEARKSLKIGSNKFVFLFFGLIRKYKGVDSVLSAFEKIRKEHPSAELIIAGKSLDDEMTAVLEKYKGKPGITIHTHHIPDEEVQTYLNAADITVFPFKKITNSTSVLLSFSFSRPSIYPLLGSLKELPKNVGYSYDPSSPEALEKVMRKALERRNELIHMEKAAYEYAKTLSWEKIAEETHMMYKGTL